MGPNLLLLMALHLPCLLRTFLQGWSEQAAVPVQRCVRQPHSGADRQLCGNALPMLSKSAAALRAHVEHHVQMTSRPTVLLAACCTMCARLAL